jgi:hypothetical protein
MRVLVDVELQRDSYTIYGIVIPTVLDLVSAGVIGYLHCVQKILAVWEIPCISRCTLGENVRTFDLKESCSLF